jgi:phosphoribosylformylglycinamidine cyclo-ligase
LDATIGDALLATHRSYLSVVKPLLARGGVKGLAHITGGGITENLPRILPEGCAAEIDRTAWTVPPIFRLLQQRGGISTEEMFRAFNMGVGMIVVCGASDAAAILQDLAAAGEAGACRIGRVATGQRGVTYI